MELARELTRPQPGILVLGNRCHGAYVLQTLVALGYRAFLSRIHDEMSLPHLVSASELKSALNAEIQSIQSAHGISIAWIHPTSSVWASRPDFHKICQSIGVESILPNTKPQLSFLNPLQFLGLGEKLGIPSLLLSSDIFETAKEGKAFATSHWKVVKRPILFRGASVGVPGRSTYFAATTEDLGIDFEEWIEELRANQGEPLFFAQDWVDESRILALPFVRFRSGEIHFLPLVDRSLQMQGTHLIEVIDPDGESAEMQSRIRSAVTKILTEIQYVGAGSIQFVVNSEKFYVNEGLPFFPAYQPLVDSISGISTTELQLKAFLDQPPGLPDRSSPPLYGILCHWMALDIVSGLPGPGRIHRLEKGESPTMVGVESSPAPGVVIHWGYQEGESVSSHSSGVIAAIVSVSRKKEDAVIQAGRALAAVSMVGTLTHNQDGLLDLLEHAWVKSGFFHSRFLEEDFVPKIGINPETAQRFIGLCLAIPGADPKTRALWSVSGRMLEATEQAHEIASQVQMTRNDSMGAWLGEIPATKDSERVIFSIVKSGERRWILSCSGNTVQIQWFPRLEEVKRTNLFNLSALVEGQIHSVRYRKNSILQPGDNALIVNALGRLVSHRVGLKVRVKEVLVKAEEMVVTGQVLMICEKIDI